MTNLKIHSSLFRDESEDGFPGDEVIFGGSPASCLALGGAAYELPYHVVLAPMNFPGVIRVGFLVTLVSSNEIRHVNFPITLRRSTAECRNKHARRTKPVCMLLWSSAKPFGTHDANESLGKEYPTIGMF